MRQRLRLLLGGFLRRPRFEREMADEMRFHIQAHADQLVQSGLPRAEAERQARAAFGSLDAAREECRQSRGLRAWDELRQDLGYALRAIRRAPSFSALAASCLAIGIGVNAAAFGVLDALLVRDFPGVERQRDISAILIAHDAEWGRTGPSRLSMPDWEVFREGLPGFSHISVAGTGSVVLRVGGEPLAVRGEFVSADFFAMLRTRPAAGRLLGPADAAAGAPPVVVISHNLWQREFGGRPAAIGASLSVGTAVFSIVGVTPKGFVGLDPGDVAADPEHGPPFLFLPLAAAPLLRPESRAAPADLDDRWLRLAGRRRPGVSPEQIEGQAAGVAARLSAAYPRDRKAATAAIRDHNGASGPTEVIAVMVFVMAIPVLILLVACANLANQLLARGMQRAREIAVRLSLGATRARLVRQLLVETSLLAVIAGAAGVLIARWITDALGAFGLVLPFRIPIDTRVLLFSIALALVTALAFGLVPALRSTRTDLASAMKEGGKGYRRSRLRSGLVVVQVAASVALLALAGVFVRAVERSQARDLGENADRVLTVSVDLDLLALAAPAGQAFQAQAVERLRGLPDVEAVALAPFSAAGSIREQPVSVVGRKPRRSRWDDVAEVSGDWFAVQHTRPLSGRLFDAAEAKSGAGVVVVDEAGAKRLWPDGSALGQTLRIGDSAAARVATVVGVIPTIHRLRQEPEGVFIVPSPGTYDPRTHLYVRTRGSAEAMREVVRAAVRDLDPRLPLTQVRTLGESLNESVSGVAQIAAGVGAMGTVALLLAALGLWGVLSFVVAQRRYEIGVRMALGARAGTVTRMIFRQSLALAALGIGIGALLAAATATLLSSMLFGLPPIDPLAFAGSTSLMLGVALAASFAPARRAAHVDPLVALRAG